MDKEEVIQKSKNTRAKLNIITSTIIDHNDLFSIVSNNWRVKDVLSHISWHEREMENLFKTMSLEGSKYWLLPLHERNEKIFKDYHTIEEKDVLEEYQSSFDDMITEMRKLNDEATTNPKLFDKMPEDWEPWKVIAGNTFEHYEDHVKQLQNRFEYLE